MVDTETQSVVASYQSHAMAVRTVAWSPDSQVGRAPSHGSADLSSGCTLAETTTASFCTTSGLDPRPVREVVVRVQ